ncbi:MAG TPA: hypothetical protein DCE65_06505 [Clostridiales bacterium]|nr:hypothetical protein [Clostridiales bacterium]
MCGESTKKTETFSIAAFFLYKAAEKRYNTNVCISADERIFFRTLRGIPRQKSIRKREALWQIR